MRGPFETTTAGSMVSPISLVGVMIRYGFYGVGILVLVMIGVSILSLWRWAPSAVDAPPAFRIAASDLARLPVSGHVVQGSRFGRAEVRQYGRLHNRDIDLAMVVVMPPRGVGMGTEFVQDLREVNLLRATRARMSALHYDLETRFGEFRATEMHIDTDGRWKQCLAFRSRLDTAAVYLTGWLCDGTGNRPSAGALACMIDKLILEAPLASKAADAFLRERMAKPTGCSGSPVTQTTDTGSRRSNSSPNRWSQPSASRRY